MDKCPKCGARVVSRIGAEMIFDCGSRMVNGGSVLKRAEACYEGELDLKDAMLRRVLGEVYMRLARFQPSYLTPDAEADEGRGESIGQYLARVLAFLKDMCLQPTPPAQACPPSEPLYYVQDARQHAGNAMLWWARGSSGYTTEPIKAEVFSLEEALDICHNRETDIPWRKDYIDIRISTCIDAQYVNRADHGACPPEVKP